MGRKGIAADLIERTATALVETGGVGLRRSGHLGAVSSDDRERLQRIAGVTVEEFNRRLCDKLAVLSDKIAEKMGEHLDADRFKPGELAFALGMLEDKRSKLDGRAQLASGSVNVQINNYGAARSREEILASIEGSELPVIVKNDQDVV